MAQESNLVSPPSVERIRFSQGHFEYSANMASCLQEQGFPAVHEGRSYSFRPGVPLAQEAALAEATYVCEARYMMDPVYAQDWSEAQLGLVYDYWTQYYIPCVEAHGYVVAGEPPSRQAYVSAFHTQDRIPWWPSDTTEMLSADKLAEIEGTCPAHPPDELMYGQ